MEIVGNNFKAASRNLSKREQVTKEEYKSEFQKETKAAKKSLVSMRLHFLK